MDGERCRPHTFNMYISVRLFAMLRQHAGSGHLNLDLPDGSTVTDALDRIADTAGLRDLIERMPLAVAVNREYANRDSVLEEGDELALVPPVSGGSSLHVRVVEGPLDPSALPALVSDPSAGATVCFLGTTRDVDWLDYEVYKEMAHERIEEILADAIDRHGLCAAAAEHRVGRVALGEPSVAIAVSSAHREAAFAGAREIIDRIKAEVPIWKQEVIQSGGVEGTRWVEGTTPDPAGRQWAG